MQPRLSALDGVRQRARTDAWQCVHAAWPLTAAANAAANADAAAAAAAAAHVFGYGQRKQGDAAASATVHGHDGATLKHAQSTVRADSGTLPVHGAQVKYRYQIILPCTCLQFSNLAHSSEQIFPFVCGKEPFYA